LIIKLNASRHPCGLTLESRVVFVGWVNPYVLPFDERGVGRRMVDVAPDFRPESHCFLLPVNGVSPVLFHGINLKLVGKGFALRLVGGGG
jgi:hypothetical protein